MYWQWINRATGELKACAIESARLEAELLMAHVLQVNRVSLYGATLNPTAEQLAVAEELLKRRLLGEPLAYLVGTREFYGLDFKVTPAVLIPRPDTEILVEQMLLKICPNTPAKIIDVGTGSGCIAVTVAKARPKARIVAIDISESALEIARLNAANHGVDSQIDFVRGNLLESRDDHKIDMIVSNPPYIKPKDMSGLMREVRDFEPRLALEGLGEEGLGLYDLLLAQAARILRPGGHLLVEIGFDQADSIRQKCAQDYCSVQIMQDLAGNDRIAIWQKR